MATTVEPVRKAARPELSFGSPISEYCLSLLNHLGLGRQPSPNSIGALGLMSCASGEGVTSIAAALAVTAAGHLKLRTILVDCNLKHPTLHRIFGVGLNPGLKSALNDPPRLREFVTPTAIENLSVLTAGDAKPGTIPDCGSPNLAHVLSELRASFDLIIVDAPPFGRGASSGIASLLDGIVLVVEAERTQTNAVQRMASSLRGAGVNLLGVVMNKRRQYVPSWLYKRV